MRKTYKYRLYPTKSQEDKLYSTLDLCRYVYNETLALRKYSYEQEQKSLKYYDTNKYLPQWKSRKPALKNVFSQCLQEAQQRVDLAFQAFFRRVKNGEKPGYPRFKSYKRYDSFTFPQAGFRFKEGKLHLSKIGNIKINLHRPLLGIVKTLNIRKTATNKWYASFSCIVEHDPLPPNNKAVGIDVGIKSFATLSNGRHIPHQKFFISEQRALAKAQRKENRKVIARIHERIGNKRKDFAHKLSKSLVNTYGIVAFEKLQVQEMIKDNFTTLNKYIADAAWKQLINYTTYKAECAGRRVVLVDPANTSQRCSRCGTIVPKDLNIRRHKCPICQLNIDRDTNAAINILALGLQCLGFSPRSPEH